MDEIVDIGSRDFWFKVVAMLQQNWALIEVTGGQVVVYFIHDGSSVFDELRFENESDAVAALRRNGFERFSEDLDAQAFIVPPSPPYRGGENPIYSSGMYWK